MTHAHPRSSRARGFTLIELMVVVAMLGILSAIAIPALTKLIGRSKTSEARIQLAKLFDGNVAYFQSQTTERGSVELIGAGGGVSMMATHRCPTPPATPAGGAAATPFTPSVPCSKGPGGRCLPSNGTGSPGYYDIMEWSDNHVWSALSFQMEQGHYYHYNFRAANALTGYGSCTFTSQAFGDLDDDGTYSTFERTGAADQNGVNAAVGLYVNLVVE